MTEPLERRLLEKDSDGTPWLGVLALAAVVAHPTQASVDLLAGAPRGHLNVCLADLVMAAAFVAWVVQRLRSRDWSPPAAAPAALLGTLWLVLSLVPQLKGAAAESLNVSRAGVAKAVQFAEYYVVGAIVFTEAFALERRRKRVVWALAAVTFSALLCALWQYVSVSYGVTDVRGSGFDSRSAFGMFLALVVPLLFGVAVFSKARWAWCVGAATVFLAMCLSLAGGPFLAMLIGVLIVAALRGRTAFAVAAVGMLVVSLFLLPLLPRDNGDVLLDSVLLYRTDDPHRAFGGDVQSIRARENKKRSELARALARGERVTAADLPGESDASWRWEQRYKEWQAALRMTAASPLFGVGAGSYQHNVNRFYDMPKYPVNLLEPDTLNGYLVWSASAGLPFLAILLALYTRALLATARAYGSLRSWLDRGMAAGVLGALAALVVGGLFTNPLVRGVGVTVALILALAETLRRASMGVAERRGR